MTDYRQSPWPPTSWGIWFGLLAGPTLWALQELAGWWITEQTCVDATSSWGPLSETGVRWLQVGIALAALAIVLLSLVMTFAAWRRSGTSAEERMQGRSRPDFLASFALLMAGVFTIALIWTAIATAILPICEAMR